MTLDGAGEVDLVVERDAVVADGGHFRLELAGPVECAEAQLG
jgi:hypothetical protein